MKAVYILLGLKNQKLKTYVGALFKSSPKTRLDQHFQEVKKNRKGYLNQWDQILGYGYLEKTNNPRKREKELKRMNAKRKLLLCYFFSKTNFEFEDWIDQLEAM